MDPSHLTQKSTEALHDAQTKALRYGHTEVDGEHLLLALLDQQTASSRACWPRPAPELRAQEPGPRSGSG
jgi:ATP-dependent Clp protease ATP-binding subunit ClpA